MKEKWNTRDLIFVSMLSILGLFGKRIFSPAANLLTDFIRIPGGSLVSGLSFVFLITGIALIRKRGCGILMGVTQGILAIFLGISSFQGVLAVIVYTIPGFVMDLVMEGWIHLRLHKCLGEEMGFIAMGMLANMTGSLLTNALFFHLQGLVFFLWMSVSAFSGFMAGYCAIFVYKRIAATIQEKRSI